MNTALQKRKHLHYTSPFTLIIKLKGEVLIKASLMVCPKGGILSNLAMQLAYGIVYNTVTLDRSAHLQPGYVSSASQRETPHCDRNNKLQIQHEESQGHAGQLPLIPV